MSESKTPSGSIVIPLLSREDTHIEFFPDELPTDFNDLADTLRAEYAPLTAWREAALEYYRQGFFSEFESILKEIVDELGNPGGYFLPFLFYLFLPHCI